MLNLIEGPALFGLLGLVPFVGGVLLLLAAVLGMGMGGVKFTLAAGLSSAARQEMMDEQSLVP
jgi:hypothetical protein